MENENPHSWALSTSPLNAPATATEYLDLSASLGKLMAKLEVSVGGLAGSQNEASASLPQHLAGRVGGRMEKTHADHKLAPCAWP